MKNKVYFDSSSGIKLCGILSASSGDKSNPIFVLCHGFSTSKDGRTNSLLETFLNDAGRATFRFDFFGHGESGGAFQKITISEAVDDVMKAVEFVRLSGYKKIGLVGSSFGGTACILAASHIGDLTKLALKSPATDYKEILDLKKNGGNLEEWKNRGVISIQGAYGQNLKLNYSFFEDAQKADGYSAAGQIHIPVLIVHGAKDETVPVEQSLRASRLFKNCRLEILAGADHIYSDPRDFDKMIQLISDFALTPP